MKKAIREALCNTLSNADYNGELGLVIKQYHDKLVFSNPGILAMPLEQIMLGGESKARNKTILNIFSFVNIGERAGSGYPLIINAAKDRNYPTPEVYDKFNPDVTKLTIFIKKLASHDENLGNDVKNLPVLPENLPIDIINNSIHKNDVKIKLTKIYVELKDEVISRNVISNLLSVSDKTSYNLILYLLDLGLIVPILGHGKGKYKFK